MRALIVDDSRSSLAQLCKLIGEVDPIATVPFLDPREALAAAALEPFAIAVVDQVMPTISGVDFILRLRQIGLQANIPILMVTGSDRVELRLAALEAGANDVITKSPHPFELQCKIRNLLMLAEAKRSLDKQVDRLALEVEKAVEARLAREEEMIFRLSRAVEFRDNDTGEHTVRVANYSRMIAETLGLPPEDCRRIFLASSLHDVGKVAIPDNVLLKPGRLDAEELAMVRTHAEIGAQVLGGSSCETVQLAAEIAGSRHERWDGTGYPQELAGEAIPLAARIVAVADVFDALTNERSYKSAMPIPEALAFLSEQSGAHFDPRCVAAFLSAYSADAVASPEVV